MYILYTHVYKHICVYMHVYMYIVLRMVPSNYKLSILLLLLLLLHFLFCLIILFPTPSQNFQNYLMRRATVLNDWKGDSIWIHKT